MNGRIRELAEQAGWTEGYYELDDGPFIEPEFNKEKFAELIVDECAKVDVEAESTGVARLIMIHFGVEE